MPILPPISAERTAHLSAYSDASTDSVRTQLPIPTPADADENAASAAPLKGLTAPPPIIPIARFKSPFIIQGSLAADVEPLPVARHAS